MGRLSLIRLNNPPVNETEENPGERGEINTVIAQEGECLRTSFGRQPIVAVWQTDKARRDEAYQVMPERQQEGNPNRNE